MLEAVGNSIREHFVPVLVIFIMVYLGRRFAMLFIARLIRRSVRSHKFPSQHAEKQREDTLIGMVSMTVRIFIWIIAGLMLLAEFGINIAPLLAGAGIAGVALGFGAQSMVKDFLAGFFIVSENQYRVGDVVRINKEIDGVVERVTMRETVLRDLDGMVHHISNGNIEFCTNMTMDYANINLDVRLSYATDIEKAERVINEVGEALAKDPEWKDRITEAPQFLRVDKFIESAMVIKIMGKTVPMEQWAVTGELRKRLKIAFDKNHIEIPFAQLTIHQSKK
jgi:small-conductance mechanosensitive channel